MKDETNTPKGPLEREVRRDTLEWAAQRCRYYLKRQNIGSWDDATDFEKGVEVACQNLERIMLEEARKLDA